MAASNKDDVMMRLVIGGMDPADVKRLADQTYGKLREEAAQHIDRLAALHRAKNTEMAADVRKYNEEAIKSTTKALSAVQGVMRQQEIAANQVRNSWRRTMEDLENITTVARGVFDVMAAGWNRFKVLAEDIAKTTNVYGSLKGSIEEMREASNGEISDMDLILTKNRAMQKELALTDGQFGAVAAAADAFADSLGTNTKDAMDKLIDGLATGKTKMLQAAGVVVDTDRAYVKYAEKIGVSVKMLTDHEKKLAVVEASLRAMDVKLAESGDAVNNFASTWDKTVAQISNVGDAVKMYIGDVIQGVIGAISIGLPGAFKIALASIKDLAPGSSGMNATLAREQLDKDIYQFEHGGSSAASDAAKKRLATKGAYDQARDAKAEEEQRKKEHAAELAAAAAKAAAERKKHADAAFKFFNKAETKLGLGMYGGDEINEDDAKGNPFAYVGRNLDTEESSDDYVKRAEAANAADEKRAAMMATINALHQGLEGVTVNEAVAYQKLADSIGVTVEQLSHEEKMQAIASEAAVQTEEAKIKAAAAADQLRAQLKETEDKAGFLSIFLFGPGGPTETYKEMDEVMQYTVDTFGVMSSMLAGSAKKVTDAMAVNLTAILTGNSAKKQSIRQVTHDVLESLSQQAISHALFETAAGFASLALGPVGGAPAAAHFTAAAMFGAVGVSAGLAARMVGNPAGNAAAAQAAASARGSSSFGPSSSSFGSGGQRSSGGGDDGPMTLIIQFSGQALHTKEEIGQVVEEALDASYAKTGRGYQKVAA